MYEDSKNNDSVMSRFGTKVAAGFLAAVMVIGAFTALVGVNLMKTDADKWGCAIGGGLFDTHSVKETIGAGSRGQTRLFDDLVEIPASARYFDISADKSVRDFGGAPLPTPSAGAVMVIPEIQVGFKINEQVCSLWTTYLKRRGALHFDDGEIGGWAKFLADKMRKSIDKAVLPVFQTVDWNDLYENPADKDGVQLYEKLQKTISENLTAQLKATLGKDYFCGTAYEYDGKADGKFECPALVVSIQKVLPKDMALITNKDAIKQSKEQEAVVKAAAKLDQAKSDAARETAINDAKNREMIAAANESAELAEQKAKQAKAANDMAPCIAAKAEGIACPLLMAVLTKQPLPQVIGSGVTPSIAVK